MSKYIDYLKDSKKKLADEHVHVAKIAEKQLDLVITQQEVELAKSEERIRAAKSNYPFNVDTIIEAIDDQDILARRISQLQEIAKELF